MNNIKKGPGRPPANKKVTTSNDLRPSTPLQKNLQIKVDKKEEDEDTEMKSKPSGFSLVCTKCNTKLGEAQIRLSRGQLMLDRQTIKGCNTDSNFICKKCNKLVPVNLSI